VKVTVPVAVAGVVTVAVNVTGEPKDTVKLELLNEVALGALFTVSVVMEDAPLVKFESPEYVATIPCGPTARVVDVNIADPDATGTAAPIAVPPSENCTVPVAFDGTVAVNVTGVV
jgi:hypothetical protein